MLVVLLVVVWPGPHASQADKLGGGLRALMLVAYAIVTTLGMPFVAQYKLGAAVLHAALLSSFAGGVALLARRAKADELELRAGETSRRDDDVRLREARRALERAKDEAAAQQAEAERIARERHRERQRFVRRPHEGKKRLARTVRTGMRNTTEDWEGLSARYASVSLPSPSNAARDMPSRASGLGTAMVVLAARPPRRISFAAAVVRAPRGRVVAEPARRRSSGKDSSREGTGPRGVTYL